MATMVDGAWMEARLGALLSRRSPRLGNTILTELMYTCYNDGIIVG